MVFLFHFHLQIDKEKAGVLVGTGMGGLSVFSDGVQALIEKGHRKITPFFIPYAITNMGSALLAIELGLMGPNYSISTACATSNYCFYAAANHIRRGEADLMIAGGTEAAIIPIGLGGFVACRALSQRNDDPQTASRPWDKDRDGFVMGEGAGILVNSMIQNYNSFHILPISDFITECSNNANQETQANENLVLSLQLHIKGLAVKYFSLIWCGHYR